MTDNGLDAETFRLGYEPGYGLCRCGCGQTTPIARRNRKEIGWVKGKPTDYVVGHNRRNRGGPAVGLDEKWCGKCQTVKPKDDFFNNVRSVNGLQGFCKDCSRANSRAWQTENRMKARRYKMKSLLPRKYGISLEDYDRILEEQGSVCAVCNKQDSYEPGGLPRLLATDHDHISGIIRGLLCGNCNRAIGLFGDDPELLRRAAEYIERHR